jgi:hypothetical protein
MYSIELIKSTRTKFTQLIHNISIEAANKIPAGFNNNIAWNYGHVIVSGYLLAYVSTGIKPTIAIPLVDKFRKGTKPEAVVTKEEINILKESSDDFLALLEQDITNQLFANIKPYATQTFGVELHTTADLLTTIFGHDVLHYSTALTFKKLI